MNNKINQHRMYKEIHLITLERIKQGPQEDQQKNNYLRIISNNSTILYLLRIPEMLQEINLEMLSQNHLKFKKIMRHLNMMLKEDI